MNAMMSSYQQYRKHDVMMANPMELVIMLYNGAIKQLRLAKMAIEEKDIESANVKLQKAQAIMMELMMGLDLSYGIAQELLKLYEFIHRRILDINVTKNAEDIAPILDILVSLRDTWEQVHKEHRGSIYAEQGTE